MADVVSESFCCCCFYPPSGHHGVGTHHYGSGGGHPAGGNAVHHHHAAGGLAGRTMTSRSRLVYLQTVELKVRMCCEGCERVVRQSLLNLRGACSAYQHGITSVEVDARMEKVRVTGYVEPGKVLREVRRSGKKAEFWPSGGTPLRFTSPWRYFRRDDDSSYRGSYNYRRRGYGDGDRHSRMREPARGADPVSNMFNDDDVNACAIM